MNIWWWDYVEHILLSCLCSAGGVLNIQQSTSFYNNIHVSRSKIQEENLKYWKLQESYYCCLVVWTNKSARCSYKSMIDVWWYQTPCVGDDNNPCCWATLGDQVSNIDNQSNINCTRISQEYVLCVQGRSNKLQYANILHAMTSKKSFCLG